MKKIVAIIVLLFVALVGWLYYINLINVDEFRLGNYAVIEKDNVKVNEPMYVSYDFEYHGNGKPTIKEIRFIKTDGSFLTNEDEGISVTAYIDKSGKTLASTQGPITEDEAKELNLLENYIQVENYKVEQKEVNVVLKVIIKAENYMNNISAVEIDYDLLGSPKTKQILITGVAN
ncbi:MAG TPA: hypothetical protein GX497_16885 [Bacillus bacterium]|nr:hypothetical protein [Bacillus sp. (in: firmicutes)]